MHLRHILAAAAVVGMNLPARAVRAQDADSILFHRGQWGTEFTVESGFAAAGLLRFRSPTRALLMDLGLSLTRTTDSYGVQSSTMDDFLITLRGGSRAYHSIGPRLFRILTIGITTSYNWHRVSQDSVGHASEGMSGGLFAELGATWLVTPHLALGTKCGVTMRYLYMRSSGTHTTQLSLTAGRVGLAGQLYF